MNMKKLKILMILIVLSSSNMNIFTIAHANDGYTPMENEIQNAISFVLKSNGVKELSDLSDEDTEALIDNINEIKSKHIDIREQEAKSSPSARSTSSYIGKLFLTTDSSTKDFPHGHAGIGHKDLNAVIESNPGDGVRKYNGRIKSYWAKRKNSGIYGVRGASAAKYRNAFNYAEKRIGKKYGFNPFDNNSFYCSELVFYAWKGQGYTINNGLLWGSIILPVHMMLDSDTYLVRKF